jgi:hypothetical protein
MLDLSKSGNLEVPRSTHPRNTISDHETWNKVIGHPQRIPGESGNEVHVYSDFTERKWWWLRNNQHVTPSETSVYIWLTDFRSWRHTF